MSSISVAAKIALGTAQFGLPYGIANAGVQLPRAEGAAILDLAKRHGINTIDTAIAYGESEAVLGELGVGSGAWNIVSKLPPMPTDEPDVGAWMEREVSASLTRLGCHRLYGLMLHQPTQLLERRGQSLYRELVAQRESGVVQKIGISVYTKDNLDLLFDRMHFDIVQTPVNILDRAFIESGWAARLKTEQIELHARSVFLQGLLLMPEAKRPAKFERWRPLWSEWSRWLRAEGLTPVEACLRYALHMPDIDKLVIGFDSAAHLADVLQVVGEPLPSLPNWPSNVDTDLIDPSHWSHL